MASREDLMQSIQPGAKLDKAFFLRVYGYEITWPGFAETALAALEAAGCSKAKGYYDSIVQEYEAGYQAERKEVAAWYEKECEKRFEKMEKERGEEIRAKQKQTQPQLNSRKRWAKMSEELGFQPIIRGR